MQTEITRLLAPIDPDQPAGLNLEDEPLLDEIRTARISDPDDLPQGDWVVSEPRKADWHRVRKLSEQALTTQSKDLQLACWWAESLCRLNGLNGLRTGIDFLSEFITRFWFQCWPSLEQDGMPVRRSRLVRLDRDLSQYLFRQPLLQQNESTLAIWQQILAFEHKINTAPETRDELIGQEGDLTMASFEQRAASFSSIEIGQQADRVEQLIAALEQLETRYASLSQDPEGDLFVLTRQTLLDITDYLQRLALRAIPLVDNTLTLHMPDSPSQPEATFVAPPVQTMSRELAINQMLEIAHYFTQNEPSSPVPFLMERAARWATMSLTDWLKEMLNDSSSMDEINNVLTGQRRQ